MVTEGAFVLRDDVLILDRQKLSTTAVERTRLEADEFVVTQRFSRSSSRVVDRAGASLLQRFRQPTTIVRAVIATAAELDEDPREVLEQAYELIKVALADGLLVGEDVAAEASITPSLEEGTSHDDMLVCACVHLVEDTEVYRVRLNGSEAALKLARRDTPAVAALKRERRVLELLGGELGPQVLGGGSIDERPYLLLEWIDGRMMTDEAARRRSRGIEGRRSLLDLALGVADVYARLHERGVVHADVHPNNALVDAAGTIRLLDFGFAVSPRTRPPSRAGIAFYFEPEMAHALLANSSVPATAAGEQYSVSALCWLLITGGHAYDFSVTRERMLRQVVDDEPVPFVEFGMVGLERTESVLRRGLAKSPGDRFPSVAAFAAALRESAQADLHPKRSRVGDRAPTMQILDEIGLADVASLSLRLEPPTASVNYGAAGIAHSLLRVSQTRGSGELLALAEAWLRRADVEAARPDGFHSVALDIGPSTIGVVSPYHTATGVNAVRALIGGASGDLDSAQRGVDDFALASVISNRFDPDLVLGSSGTLVIGSVLLGLEHAASVDVSRLRSIGDEVARRVWREIEMEGPIARSTRFRHLGVAHGWAGYLHAQLQWARATGGTLPDGIEERLRELVELAESTDEGLRWAWYVPAESPTYMAGWCNGTAGHVMLLALAGESLDAPYLIEHAERAATAMYHDAGGGHTICCGYAGQAFALLRLFRSTGDEGWLAKARWLADRALLTARTRPRGGRLLALDYSLYKGSLGVAVLCDALEDPATSGMPLFDPEPWLTR